MNLSTKSTLEYHLKKLDQAALGLMGVGMVMNAIMTEEENPNSKFPYKSNDFVSGCLVKAVVVLAGEVSHYHEKISELLGVEN
jgi:hypothetical protein